MRDRQRKEDAVGRLVIYGWMQDFRMGKNRKENRPWDRTRRTHRNQM